MGNCLYCGAELTQKSHNNRTRKYCNINCYRRAVGCKEYVNAYCLNCGKVFRETRERPNTFCSKSCSSIYHGKIKAIEKSENDQVNPDTYKRFIEATEKVKRLAEMMERERRCGYCGKWFEPVGTVKYCSDECARKADNIRRDHRLTRNGPADYSITLPRLFDRDKGVCQLCGKHLDLSGDPNCEDYPSIDHVKPINKGGLHIWSNVQLACRKCNVLKSDQWEEPPPVN